MSKTMHQTGRIEHAGAIDADGHILEPPTIWEDYIDPKYRDRALRFRLDEQGLEELEIGGERSMMSRRGFPATLGAMGAPDLPAIQKDPGTHLRRRGAVRQHGSERAARVARRRRVSTP